MQEIESDPASGRRREEFLQNLGTELEEIVRIENETRGQNNGLWRQERRKRITASNFGRICKLKSCTSKKRFVNSILNNNFRGSIATQYGKDNEENARRDFMELIKKTPKEFLEISSDELRDCGFFIDADDPYLGASPDGMLGTDGLVEIKCPYKARSMTPREAIHSGVAAFVEMTDGDQFKIKRTSAFYYQVQGQLHVTKRNYCYFILWTPRGMLFEKIDRDEHFFQTVMRDKLKHFYFDCYLPGLLRKEYVQENPI